MTNEHYPVGTKVYVYARFSSAVHTNTPGIVSSIPLSGKYYGITFLDGAVVTFHVSQISIRKWHEYKPDEPDA